MRQIHINRPLFHKFPYNDRHELFINIKSLKSSFSPFKIGLKTTYKVVSGTLVI